MLRLYVPVAVTVILIASMTFWESIYSDRFTSSSVTAAEFGKRFANLPKEIGPWVGVDVPVAEETLKIAGAVNHVNRRYTNIETKDEVDLWLVVGHSRDISRHTPDICYPSHGFSMDGVQLKQEITPADGGKKANFHTARFKQESSLGHGGPLKRVFWAWNPNYKDQVDWVAPESSRLEFGNNTALYKLYFTSPMKERDESVADNTAVKFAELALPVINETLFPTAATTPTVPSGEALAPAAGEAPAATAETPAPAA